MDDEGTEETVGSLGLVMRVIPVIFAKSGSSVSTCEWAVGDRTRKCRSATERSGSGTGTRLQAGSGTVVSLRFSNGRDGAPEGPTCVTPMAPAKANAKRSQLGTGTFQRLPHHPCDLFLETKSKFEDCVCSLKRSDAPCSCRKPCQCSEDSIDRRLSGQSSTEPSARAHLPPAHSKHSRQAYLQI